MGDAAAQGRDPGTATPGRGPTPHEAEGAHAPSRTDAQNESRLRSRNAIKGAPAVTGNRSVQFAQTRTRGWETSKVRASHLLATANCLLLKNTASTAPHQPTALCSPMRSNCSIAVALERAQPTSRHAPLAYLRLS